MATAPTTPPPGSIFLPIRPDWLASRQEPILEPGLPIVDPHHHLWDRPDHEPYLLPQLLSDTASGHNVVATLFVECRAMYRAGAADDERSLGETAFVNGVAAMSASGSYGATRHCAGIVGNVDLRFGDRAKPALEKHMALSGGRFRGIRNGSAYHEGIRATSANPPPGLLLDATFRRGFACLATLGLTFDAWLLHTQIEELTDLAKAFPDTKIIIDHIGGPIGVGRYAGKRQEVFAVWKPKIEALARCRNVHVKLGGMAMTIMGFDFEKQPQAPSSEALAAAWKPYIETCIAAFGPRRSMFESNFPVDKGGCSYPVLWNAFKRLAAGCSADEKTALFSGTATKVYGLTLA